MSVRTSRRDECPKVADRFRSNSPATAIPNRNDSKPSGVTVWQFLGSLTDARVSAAGPDKHSRAPSRFPLHCSQKTAGASGSPPDAPKKVDGDKPDSVRDRVSGRRQPFLSPGLRQGPAESAEAAAANATSTRKLPRLRAAGQAAQAPCYVLHRMGFIVPRSLRAGRWALTPPFHPYLKAHEAPPGGMFSVTLSVATNFRPLRPRILRGPLPGGVRTFLPRANRERLPAVRQHLGHLWCRWQGEGEKSLMTRWT